MSRRPPRRTTLRSASRAPRSVTAVGAGAALLLLGLTPVVQAETPTPVAGPTSTAAQTPTATPTPTPSPTPPSTTSGPSAQDAESPSPTPTTTTTAPTTSGVTLVVTSSGGPVAGAFYEDLGRFAFAGAVYGIPDGTTVTIARRVGSGAWTRVATATVSGGRYAASLPVQAAGVVSFRASAPLTESPDLVSATVPVTVRDSVVALARPARTVDSLKDLTVTGGVVPARAGVAVRVEVRRSGAWKPVAVAATDATGRFTTTVGYDKGGLASYTIRASYHATNTDRWETSGSQAFSRIAVLDPAASATSGADVAKTYRKGCPVGPSKLRTVHLNYYGRDKRMHRGVIIVRTDLTQEITRGFSTALTHRYPIAKMNNPNTYGGSDPKQMAANNTSGFNCRKVVGNPYKQSPHSYGIAIDVNTVQNPYRDAKGKWWPSKKYTDRTPKRWGMLSKGSYLTKSLRKDRFFWGGLWNPGRDYQHFEYRG